MDEYKAGAESASTDAMLNITGDIVAAYVSNNTVQVGDIASLIGAVHATITKLGSAAPEPVAEVRRAPAVPIKKSVTDDHIVCLEDGKKFKSLKRHLMTHYNLTPEQYREKWGLPHDYPMVAPSYALSRSRLAKEMGLGRKAGYRKPARARSKAA
jgi:predicted transcriptional regulator